MVYVDLSQVYVLLNKIISINCCLLVFNCISCLVSVLGLIRYRKGVF